MYHNYRLRKEPPYFFPSAMGCCIYILIEYRKTEHQARPLSTALNGGTLGWGTVCLRSTTAFEAHEKNPRDRDSLLSSTCIWYHPPLELKLCIYITLKLFDRSDVYPCVLWRTTTDWSVDSGRTALSRFRFLFVGIRGFLQAS